MKQRSRTGCKERGERKRTKQREKEIGRLIYWDNYLVIPKYGHVVFYNIIIGGEDRQVEYYDG